MGTRKYFGTDGIRDVAGEGRLAPERVRALGESVGRWLGRTRPQARVLVGRDPRESGPTILGQLAGGILGGGHRLVDGGVLTTPAVQTLCREEPFDLAIVISASHNPARDNGIKFFGGNGRKLPDDAEHALEELMDAALADPVARDGVPAPETDPDAAARYERFVREECFPKIDLSGVKLVLDCAHGAGSTIGPELLARFGADVDVVGAAPDGRNINEGAGVFFVEDLADRVRSDGAVLGMALDGDADRVLMVDEKGSYRDGDHMLGLLAADLKTRGELPGNRLVTTIMANMGLMVFLRDLGVTCDTVPVGDRFVAARMAETGAAVGGEQSGHIIFNQSPRWFGDGLYTALRIIDVIQRSGKPLSELCAGVEKFPQVLKNVPVREKPPLEGLDELHAEAARAEEELAGEGRVVLRYSGTEPLLRVMVEGRDQAQIERLTDAMAAVVVRTLG